MEIKLLSIFLTLNLQLTKQTLLIYTDTHGTELEAATQNRIPDQNITIQSCLPVFSNSTPIIIVRSSAIMLLAIAQLAANTLNKYSAVFLTDSILALLWSHIRIHIQQILCMNEMNLSWQEWLDFRIMLASEIFRAENSCIDAAHYVFQEDDSTVFAGYHSFPVPLVNIKRMQIVEFFIGTNCIHISIHAISRLYIIFGKGKSLPLGKRVHHLCLSFPQVLDRKTYRALHAVQIIIDSKSLQYKERSSNAAKAKLCTQILLKEFLYQFDTHFGLAHIQQRLVPFRFYQFAHFRMVFILYYRLFSIVGCKGTNKLLICKHFS